MRRIPHVGTGGRIGGQHPAFGRTIVDQHVDANGASWVQPLHHGNGGDVKAERRHQRQRWWGSGGARFNFGAKVFEQLQQR